MKVFGSPIPLDTLWSGGVGDIWEKYWVMTSRDLLEVQRSKHKMSRSWSRAYMVYYVTEVSSSANQMEAHKGIRCAHTVSFVRAELIECWTLTPYRKRKLLDKSIPNGILQNPSFAEDSRMYQDLLETERRLDWTMMRKRVEIQDALGRIPTVSFVSHSFFIFSIALPTLIEFFFDTDNANIANFR
jgi:hypothetical protein